MSSTLGIFVRALVVALWLFPLVSQAGSARLVPLPVDGVPSEPEVSCLEEEEPRLDPGLSASSFLQGAEAKSGKVETIIGKYSREAGLLAGYSGSNGKRLLIRSWLRSDGRPMAEVVHRNDHTGRIELLLGRARLVTDEGQRQYGEYQVAGIDLMPAMREIRAARKNAPSASHAGLRAFMLTPEGRALSEAIPALYATLERFADDEGLKDLKAPLGALLAGLQMASGVYNELQNGEQIFGAEKAARLRSACQEEGCKYKGQHFKILSPGVFDSVSIARGLKPKGTSCKELRAKGKVGNANRSIGPFSVEPRAPGPFGKGLLDGARAKNGDGTCTSFGDCFGMCGMGCTTPGEIWTVQCFNHDMCVCRYGHLACVNVGDIPPECLDCGSLWDAVGSFLEELFDDGGQQSAFEELGDEFVWWDDNLGGA